jgi:hypothetical protein
MLNFFKSKTINFNILYAGIAAVLVQAGIPIPEQYILLGQTLLNIVMRYITKGPMSDK